MGPGSVKSSPPLLEHLLQRIRQVLGHKLLNVLELDEAITSMAGQKHLAACAQSPTGQAQVSCGMTHAAGLMSKDSCWLCKGLCCQEIEVQLQGCCRDAEGMLTKGRPACLPRGADLGLS